MYAYTYTLTRINACLHKLYHTHKHRHTYIHTCTFAYTHTHTHSHIVQAHLHTLTHQHARVHVWRGGACFCVYKGKTHTGRRDSPHSSLVYVLSMPATFDCLPVWQWAPACLALPQTSLPDHFAHHSQWKLMMSLHVGSAPHSEPFFEIARKTCLICHSSC